jgi:hypothetical protein
MRGDGRGNAGLWTPRKTKQQVFLRAHSPWKSLRDSHIPTAATSSGKVESQKQASHFPLHCDSPLSEQTKKEAWRRVAALPAFRLILQLENADDVRDAADTGDPRSYSCSPCQVI